MIRSTICIGLGVLVVGFAAPPASASYMETCKQLIGEWETCRETGSECAPQQSVLEEKCKCHSLEGDTWKLVNAAVGKDDVCEPNPWPPGQPPIPSPPHDPSPSDVPGHVEAGEVRPDPREAENRRQQRDQ